MTSSAATGPHSPTPASEQRTFPLLGRLWRDWMWPHRGMLLLNLLFVFAFAGANSLYPEVIRRSVNALQSGDVDALSLIGPAIVAITLLKGGTLYIHRILTNLILTRIEANLQIALYQKLIDADMASLAKEPSASLATRFSADVMMVRRAVERLINNLLRETLTVLGLFGAMLYIDWELTLISLAVFPLAIWPIVAIGNRLRKLGKDTAKRIAAMTALVAESLSGVQIAKTYRMEPYLKGVTTESFEALRKLKIRAAQKQAMIDPMMEVLGGIAVAAVIYLIGARIAAGTNTLGDITGFIAALLLSAQPLRALGNLNAQVQLGLAGARRVFDLLDEPTHVRDAPNAKTLKIDKAEIVFDDITFGYGEGDLAIRNLTLTAPGGAKVALVGRSGAGKSTLFNLVPRLYDVESGAVRIDGQDIRTVTQASLREAIALVSQEAVLFNDTVRANIAFGRPAASEDELIAAARAAAAHDFIMELPKGYDTPVGERGDRLSGGQRQRLSIARAFLRDAPILLLDEATSALDAESEDTIRKALARLAQGRTTLIIAHRLSTILDADLIAVLDEGRLVEAGRHEELLAKNGLYASLYRLQFAGVQVL